MSDPGDLREQIGGLDYPVSKEDLIRRAQETGAETELLEALRFLPANQFTTPTEVGEALADLG